MREELDLLSLVNNTIRSANTPLTRERLHRIPLQWHKRAKAKQTMHEGQLLFSLTEIIFLTCCPQGRSVMQSCDSPHWGTYSNVCVKHIWVHWHRRGRCCDLVRLNVLSWLSGWSLHYLLIVLKGPPPALDWVRRSDPLKVSCVVRTSAWRSAETLTQ